MRPTAFLCSVLAAALCATLAACAGPTDGSPPDGQDQGDFSESGLPSTGLARAASGQASDELTSSENFHLKAGEHGAEEGGLRALHLGVKQDRTLRFKVKFSANVPYTTRAASNQSDWNKLMGITTNRIHRNSIRLGWAWNPTSGQVDLGYYGYTQGTRTMPKLTSVALETWVDVEIHLDNGGERVIAGGIKHEERSSLGLSGWIPTMTWVLCTAYFGGDEKAPHDMDVQVKDLSL